MNDANFDEFCQDYLRQWETRATVRGKARYRLPPDIALLDDIYPVSMQPFAEHPAVLARGPEVLRELMIHSVYLMQADIASIETTIVGRLCCELAEKGPGCPVPESARQVALTIATDEAYHAYTAREFVEDVRQLSGIEPVPETERPHALRRSLELVTAHSPPDLRREAETMVLCLAEHFVTEQLFGIRKSALEDNPFLICIREHLIDEGRHQVFFRHMLTHLWANLDDERRTALGRLAVLFLDDFLGSSDSFEQGSRAILKALGFSPEEAQAIASDAPEGFRNYMAKVGKPNMQHAKHMLELVRRCGMTEHPPTRELLEAAGWVSAADAA